MSMRHIFRLFLSGFFALSFALAQISAQTSGPNTVFWKISGKGLASPSYLFGTIHIMPKDQFESFRVVDEKLKESRQMVLEMAIDVPLKQQIEWARQMMLPEGHTIRDYISEEKFTGLKKYVLDSLGVKELSFNTYIKLKPFAFYSALIPSVIGKKIEGYELYFSKIAKKKDIPVRELESFELQIGIFDSIPNAKQMDMFFNEGQDLRQEFTKTLDLYKEQDIYKMSESISEDSTSADFENQLINLRNNAWVPKLIAYMTEMPSFIAVGAGHLAGNHGIILQLRKEGYNVEPIMLRE